MELASEKSTYPVHLTHWQNESMTYSNKSSYSTDVDHLRVENTRYRIN